MDFPERSKGIPMGGKLPALAKGKAQKLWALRTFAALSSIRFHHRRLRHG